MKLTRKHRRLIVLGIGIVIIIFGLLQALFHLEINKKVTDEVTFVLMLVAAALLFTKDKKSEGNNIESNNKGNDMTDLGMENTDDPGNNSEGNNKNNINAKASEDINEQSDSNH